MFQVTALSEPVSDLGPIALGTFALTNAEFGAKIPTNKPDLLVPVFISGYLPHGVIGLIVVALIAAWMFVLSPRSDGANAPSINGRN